MGFVALLRAQYTTAPSSYDSNHFPTYNNYPNCIRLADITELIIWGLSILILFGGVRSYHDLSHKQHGGSRKHPIILATLTCGGVVASFDNGWGAKNVHLGTLYWLRRGDCKGPCKGHVDVGL
ncbi:hypothetical protein VNO77_22969 [Canavalia gladiata]|uniref:Uncharacterized protein n=1 Tax=Canavalia gladiata TaxID=3824 RepID=A0AAN9L6W9_CANGL